MISFDQILLLEEKVESAVNKIRQLQAENDALRSKCAELTNALSSKSERLTSFEQDQNKIETGIVNALNRLSAIENLVLHSNGSPVSNQNQRVQPTLQTNTINPEPETEEQKESVHQEITEEPVQEQEYKSVNETPDAVNPVVSNETQPVTQIQAEPVTQIQMDIENVINRENSYQNFNQAQDDFTLETPEYPDEDFYKDEEDNQQTEDNSQFDIF